MTVKINYLDLRMHDHVNLDLIVTMVTFRT